ncbi:NUDIX hydrolase domain-like protein [Lasiosphaeris hirsuta]|uniref:NUDIX hydrolase domain-like protein n=1 Tax=Lasiosphaeris hirsuta TaxID=260670 RepID=A0AA40BDI9_9PEZI|nr:NUDIX hydrolase domain-like protein [Lasiosphaeris hirsuta]
MTSQDPVVRVGVAAVVTDAEGKVVMGIRKGSHGLGHWQFPGGHLEFGEDPLVCAERETLEETGLVVHADKVVAVTNDVFTADSKHYITLFVSCRRVDDAQQPETLEPEKCEGWHWRSWDEVRGLLGGDEDAAQQKLFLPIINLLRKHDSPERLFQA